MSPDVPDLCLVVPCYEEAGVIESTLDTLIAHLDASGRSWQVVVADDGSSDATVELVEVRAAREPRVIPIRLGEHLGKGAALRAGFARAHGKVIAFVDADLAYGPEAIDRVVAAVEAGADFVAGERHGGAPTPRESDYDLGRRVASQAFGLLLRSVLPTSDRDTQCGIKAFRGVVGERLFEGTREDGFAIDVELFVLAGLAGLRIERVPVEMAHRSDSRVRLGRDSVRMAAALARIRARLLRQVYRPAIEYLRAVP